jgi:iron complex transport system permease protein
MNTLVKTLPLVLPERCAWKMAVAPLLLVLSFLLSLCVGQYPVELPTLLRSLLSPESVSGDVRTVVWDVRLPRLFAAVIVGSALAVAGAAYQGIFRNPLVSPNILGVTHGAALGAALAIYCDQPVLMMQLWAFAGGLLAVGLVCLVAKAARFHAPTLSLVLAGIAVGALIAAGISVIKMIADPYSQLTVITFWLMGGINAVVSDDVWVTLCVVVAAMVPMVLLRWRMNLLSQDDEEAESLGVPVRFTRGVFIVTATLMTSAVVAIAGTIGFVGLIVPHIARLWIGPDFAKLLPTSLFLGGAFLIITDTLARTVAPVEIPLGVITSLVGAPFFIWLLVTTGRK